MGVTTRATQFQLSMMPIQKKLHLYSGGSHIFGQYGNLYNARIGTSWFPYKNRVLRWNTEALYLFRRLGIRYDGRVGLLR